MSTYRERFICQICGYTEYRTLRCYGEYDPPDEPRSLKDCSVCEIIKKEDRSTDELLTSDCQVDRHVGKARVDYEQLLKKVRKMSKKARINMFVSRWVNPIYETHESAGVAGLLYRQGYNDGYHQAMREL